MNKKVAFSLAIFVVLLGFIVACGLKELISGSMQDTNLSTNEIVTDRPKETPILDQTATPVSKWRITPFTPRQTLEVGVQEVFYRLLVSNGNCELPCFLGITPGETSIGQATEILDGFSDSGVNIDQFFQQDDLRMYSIQITTNLDIDIIALIQLITKNDQIQEIRVFTDSSIDGSYAVFDKHLNRFSLREIFQRHGIPNSVYITPPDTSVNLSAYAIHVFFENGTFLITASGNAKLNELGDYSICPNIGEGDIGLSRFILLEPSSEININDIGGVDLNIDEESFSIEQVLNVTMEEFYTAITEENPSCFNVINP